MKRLSIAGILAVAIHAVAFSIDGNWFDPNLDLRSRSNPISLSLVYPPAKQVRKTESLPVPIVAPSEKKKQTDHAAPEKIKPLSRPATKKKRPESKTLKPVDRPVIPLTKHVADLPDIQSFSADDAQTPPVVKPKTADISDHSPVAPPNKSPEAVPRRDKDPTSNQSVKKQNVSAAGQPSASEIIKEAVPLYKDNPPPIYPRSAQRRGYQGTVVLDVLVTRDGRVKEVKISQSSRHAILDRAAVDSVRKWRFEPGKRGDEKVDMRVKVPIRFRLDE